MKSKASLRGNPYLDLLYARRIQRLLDEIQRSEKFNDTHEGDGRFGAGGGSSPDSRAIQSGKEYPPGIIFAGGQSFGNGMTYNTVLKTQFEGTTYFVKQLKNAPDWHISAKQSAASEQVGPAIGEVIGANIIPTGHATAGSSTYIVAPWQNGAVSGAEDFGLKQIRGALTQEDATRNLALEYLTGSGDRRPANIMLSGGKVREIDFGFSNWTIKQMSINDAESALYDATSTGNLRTVNDAAMRDILGRTKDILATARQYLSSKQTGVVRDRLAALQEGYSAAQQAGVSPVTWANIQSYVNASFGA